MQYYTTEIVHPLRITAAQKITFYTTKMTQVSSPNVAKQNKSTFVNIVKAVER